MAKLTQTATISSGDWITIYKENQGDFRGISFTDFIASLTGSLAPSVQEPNTQYSAPVDGGTILVDDNDEDTHLIITPALGLALLTITLPTMGSLRDKQKLIVNCTQAIGGLTINGNGATVGAGAPALLAADEYFTLKYDATLNVWYRIG